MEAYSNTTLVKVKSVYINGITSARADSNTTLVKVKLGRIGLTDRVIKFKYNSC